MISVLHSPITLQKFVILDCPTEQTLASYVPKLQQENVSALVRICHRTGQDPYDGDALEKETGIRVIDDIKFSDGGIPDGLMIERWLKLIAEAREQGTTVGVHCVAGIGRAPVLVTIALVESGMDGLDAISHVRRHRRGALNKQQVRFIDTYRSKRQKRSWLGWLRG
ncbi:protein-tyrosine phosphatase-like protein [Phycomyces nitens]|nr:protein-tyrosine phosphatase-like protein [Phycomyces nitens]